MSLLISRQQTGSKQWQAGQTFYSGANSCQSSDLPYQDAEGKFLGASAYIQTNAPIRAKTEELLD